MISEDEWQRMAIQGLKWLNSGLDAAYEAIEAGPGAMIAVSDEIHSLCRDVAKWIAQNQRSTECDWILAQTVEAFEQLATMWAEQARSPSDSQAMKDRWVDTLVVFVQALVIVQGESPPERRRCSRRKVPQNVTPLPYSSGNSEGS